MAERRLEYRDGQSDKFWSVSQVESRLELRWGRIDTAGQVKTKVFDTPALAKAEAEKLVSAKLKKGYFELAKSASSKTPSRPDPSTSPAKGKASTKAEPAISPQKRAAAAAYLKNHTFPDGGFLDEKKLADAWLAVGNELSPAALDKISKKMAKQEFASAQLAIRVLRDASDVDLKARMLAFLPDSIDQLKARLLWECERADCLREGASLLFRFRDTIHVGSVVGRTQKTDEPSAKIVRAARAVIDDIPNDSRWLEFCDFLTLIMVLCVLIRWGTEADREKVCTVRDLLGDLTAEDNVRDMRKTIDHLGEALEKPLTGGRPKEASASPTEALAKSLGWSVAGKNWRASVMLGAGKPNSWFGALQESTQVSLRLDPSKKPYWTVDVRDKQCTKHYSNWTGEVSQDDFGLPALDKIEDFPRWLHSISKLLKTRFDLEQGHYDAGRYKKGQRGAPHLARFHSGPRCRRMGDATGEEVQVRPNEKARHRLFFG